MTTWRAFVLTLKAHAPLVGILAGLAVGWFTFHP